MEFDLIMGLAKLKTTLPLQGSPELTQGELPDFSALLSAETLDDSVPPDDAPLPEQPMEISTTTPQVMAGEIKPSLELEVRIPPAPEDETRPDTQEIVRQAPLPVPLSEAQPKVDQPSANQPVQTRAAEPILNSTITASAPLDQVTKFTEVAPNLPTAPVKRAQLNLPQKPEIEAKLPNSVAADPVPNLAPATKTKILPLPLSNQAMAPQAPTSDEPKINLPSPPVQSSTKMVAQPLSTPPPAIGFTNVETITDDPAEIQFGIKIERQTVETVHVSRATPPTAPVATQITAQLPQLLTKADKQTIELRLDPPELGRVTIHLTTNDQQVTAQVVADRPDTVDLMRRHAELLTATLARAGFSQTDLSFQQGQGQGHKDELEQFQSIAGISESDEPALPSPTLTGQNGRLDIRL